MNTNTGKLMYTISKVFPITSVKQLDIISHVDDKAEEGIIITTQYFVNNNHF